MSLACCLVASALLGAAPARADHETPSGTPSSAITPSLRGMNPPGLYRAAFERGLVALEAGRTEEAAQHFRAAGELAPEAPVWRAYLARAEGRESATELDRTPDGRGAWGLVPVLSEIEARFDPTGVRLLSGFEPATLWDARTGERIAVLEHRGPRTGHIWIFEQTGRLVVGVSWNRQGGDLCGLDVRDARTGDPLDVWGAEKVRFTSGTRFEWVPE